MRRLRFVLLLVGLQLVTPAVASASPVVIVDAPTGLVQPFTLSGAAGDPAAASSPGVSAIHVYATPLAGGAAVFVGATTVGLYRPDMAGYGPQYLYSGWQLAIRGLAPGAYRFTVYALSTITGTWGAATLDRTIANDVRILVEHPANTSVVAQPFVITGAAADLSAATGTGITAVHVHLYRDGSFVAAAAATYGNPRPDVVAAYGLPPQFTNSGFSLPVSGVAPGTYQLYVYAYSQLSGWSAYVLTVSIDLKVATPTVEPQSGTYESFAGVLMHTSTPGGMSR